MRLCVAKLLSVFGIVPAVCVTLLVPFSGGAQTADAAAPKAWVRVSQVGYEAGGGTARAYLMSTAAEPGATFSVTDGTGNGGV